MWTEAHRARHEPGLKGLVAACAVEEIAAWLERADPPRSGRATPVRRVVGAIAWHLRVGGPWRALAAGWPPSRSDPPEGCPAEPGGADRLWLVPTLARARPVRRSAARGGTPSAAQGRQTNWAELGHHRHA